MRAPRFKKERPVNRLGGDPPFVGFVRFVARS
jgi:hypothetical protein